MTIAFCFLLLISILLSTVFQLATADEGRIQEGFMNAVAVPLGVALSLFCFLVLDRDRVAQIISGYSRVSLMACWVLLLWQQSLGMPGWLHITDETTRFSAFSQNPNQLALYLLPIPFFSVIAYLLKQKSYRSMCLEIVFVVLLNVFIIGKGLFVSWVISLFVFFVVGGNFVGRPRLTTSFFIVRLALGGLFLSVAFPVFLLLYSGQFPGSQSDQGSIRVALWLNGLIAWLENPFFGNGPGHYSGLLSPFDGLESHNFFVDWLSAYGVIGGGVLVGFFGHACFVAVKQKNWVIFCFFVALLSQITFHFYGRQPVFWLWWIFGGILCFNGKGGIGRVLTLNTTGCDNGRVSVDVDDCRGSH